MPRLKRLSGSEVAAILVAFGFEVVSQRGSHIKLQRLDAFGHQETLHVPRHVELETGTCRAILRQATKYIPLDDLRSHFYSE